MFGRFLKRVIRPLLITNSIFITNYFQHHYSLIQQPTPPTNSPTNSPPQQRNIQSVQLCQSSLIKEGSVNHFTINDAQGNPYDILVIKSKGKYYGLSATNTYTDPLHPHIKYSLKDGILFNDKLLCPHTGSAFNITTGSVEYGPAQENLPKFYVEDKNGILKVYYPAKMPIKVLPKTTGRNKDDLRKVVIVAGDDNAVMGAIDALTQYDFTGEITVVNKQDEFPFHKELLHQAIPNFKQQLNITDNQLTSKQYKLNEKNIEKLLEQNIYRKLYFRSSGWYYQHGIDFVFTQEKFRVISKRFYPYLSFHNGFKIEYDGLIVASATKPIYPILEGIINSPLPLNVFSPHLNKAQHSKLVKFLNLNKVNSLIVFGLNNESLQFCSSLKQSFPEIKIKLLDFNKLSKIDSQYGPQLSKAILSEYTKRGIQFYLQINNILSIQNSVQIYDQHHKDISYSNSIKVVFPQKEIVSADCAVIFSNNSQAQMDGVKNAKYTDIEFTNLNRIIVDPFMRSDSRRIFGAGMSSSAEFFFTKKRYEGFNSLVSYEQGLTAAFNVMALNVPFHYIPFSRHNHFGKQLLYAGVDNHNLQNILIYGSVENWDFICLYADEDEILAVSASPSRQQQFQIVRESFRLNCAPSIQSLAIEEWTIDKLHQLIKYLNKSGCYKDLIHNLENKENIGDVIWVERKTHAFSNDHPLTEDERDVEVDQKGYVRQL